MKLEEHYDKMFQTSIPSIIDGTHAVDNNINSLSDNRAGITLLLRPSESVIHDLQHFTALIRSIEPDQYYHPDSDLHITILSIVSCFDGFSLSMIDRDAYISAVNEAIAETPPFELSVVGITTAREAVIACGYPKKDTLNSLRNKLRHIFRTSPLYHRMDVRYAISTAHLTLTRFRKKVERGKALADMIDKHRHTDFGNFTVKEIELVYNDWYQRKDKVELLSRFELRNEK